MCERFYMSSSQGDLRVTVNAQHGIFWAFNMLVVHHAADDIDRVDGIDGLILAGQRLTEEVIERFQDFRCLTQCGGRSWSPL